jgi:hypothetical protein
VNRSASYRWSHSWILAGLIGRAEISSFVQLRGSIPLFWGQDLQSIAPKPPIVIVRSDPFYTATILHFRDLFSRYGSPLLILNLVKSVEKVPRETILKVITRSPFQLYSKLRSLFLSLSLSPPPPYLFDIIAIL